MPNLFSSILNTTSTAGVSINTFFYCTICSLALGALIATCIRFRSQHTKSFLITVALLPAVVQMVILLVNGNLGAGVAVAGTFSLVRFRSAPGTAKEICGIFLAMAVGLATGMGYLILAIAFTVLLCAVCLLYTVTHFGESKKTEKALKVTIPEELDYTGAFDDLFQKYTLYWSLVQVKTTNMGSLYKLEYRILLRDPAQEKQFLDDLRCRNGNLEIVCGRIPVALEEL